MTLDEEIVLLSSPLAEGGVRKAGVQDANVAAAVRMNCRNWDEWLRSDPQLARLEMAIARCARIQAGADPTGAVYAQALEEERKYRAMRLAVWEERAGRRPANAVVAAVVVPALPAIAAPAATRKATQPSKPPPTAPDGAGGAAGNKWDGAGGVRW